ncbi:MAG: hypothetical protein GY756_04680 [bacterium]|nr:hypothetical protein [bacterium]
MKDNINWDLQRGYIPEKLNFDKNLYYRKLVLKRLPRGFENLPNVELLIDRMVFYMKLRIILDKKYDKIKNNLV